MTLELITIGKLCEEQDAWHYAHSCRKGCRYWKWLRKVTRGVRSLFVEVAAQVEVFDAGTLHIVANRSNEGPGSCTCYCGTLNVQLAIPGGAVGVEQFHKLGVKWFTILKRPSNSVIWTNMTYKRTNKASYCKIQPISNMTHKRTNAAYCNNQPNIQHKFTTYTSNNLILLPWCAGSRSPQARSESSFMQVRGSFSPSNIRLGSWQPYSYTVCTLMTSKHHLLSYNFHFNTIASVKKNSIVYALPICTPKSIYIIKVLYHLEAT